MNSPSGNGARTILLVEDDPLIRDLLRTVLSREGYTILEAGDGDEALKKATGWDGAIDLLVTDVVMPNLSGPALAIELRNTRPETRVLFCSGYTPEVIPEGAPFLQKPFAPEELLAVVEALLD